MPDTNEFQMTNIDPDKVSEALAKYTDGRRLRRAVNKRIRDDQLYYESEHGIDAKEIRERYNETLMSAEELQAKFVVEQITRRALNLWDAETPEDFEHLMEQASQVEAASGPGAERLAEARARSDGFNSGLRGSKALTDNPHTPGSLEHQAWALGCADAIGEPREASPMQAQPEQQKRGRGRPPGSPNRKQASANGAAQTSQEADPTPEEDAGDPAAALFSDTIGEVPA